MKKRLISMLIVVLMVLALSACSNSASAPSSPEASGSSASSSAVASESHASSQSASQSASTETSLHPIYTYKDALSLGGVKRPQMDSRASIDKALPKEKKEKLKIGATMVSQSMAWFVEVGNSIKKKAADYGWEASLLICDFDPQKQSTQIDTFISQKVDAIILDSADLATGKELVARAVAAGIPVVGIGQQLEEDSNIITSVMSNSYQTAWNVAQVTAKKMQGKEIKAAALLGMLGSNSSESRINGMMGGLIFARAEQAGKPMVKEDAMMAGQKMMEDIRANGKASYPDLKFEVLAVNGDARWTEEGGQKATEDVMTAHKDVNLLIVDQDFMGLGAVKALEGMGLKAGGDDGVQIMCAADSYKPSLELIKEGKILVTGYGAAATIGGNAVELLHKIFVEGYDASNMVISQDLPPIAIDATNVDEYIDPNSDFAKVVPFTFLTIDEYNKQNASK